MAEQVAAHEAAPNAHLRHDMAFNPKALHLVAVIGLCTLIPTVGENGKAGSLTPFLSLEAELAARQWCTGGACPDVCSYDPCPQPGPEEDQRECEVTGPTDFCSYPTHGCPPDEEREGTCCYILGTPILIDLANDGFRLTSLERGVPFIIGKTFYYQVSWTQAGTDDAWLTLDRNGNGTIDNGQELFGNYTEQPDPPPGHWRNGFLALAEFDKAANGGNMDGRIDQQDSVFRQLRLWQDRNHNGVSEPSELFSLEQFGITGIDLDYRFSGRRDRHRNLFYYRAKVHGQPGQTSRWAYDVFLNVSRRGARFGSERPTTPLATPF